ncbi:MAG: hypothetical protein AAF846_24130 [Chloroflexota bacterium]
MTHEMEKRKNEQTNWLQTLLQGLISSIVGATIALLGSAPITSTVIIPTVAILVTLELNQVINIFPDSEGFYPPTPQVTPAIQPTPHATQSRPINPPPRELTPTLIGTAELTSTYVSETPTIVLTGMSTTVSQPTQSISNDVSTIQPFDYAPTEINDGCFASSNEVIQSHNVRIEPFADADELSVALTFDTVAEVTGYHITQYWLWFRINIGNYNDVWVWSQDINLSNNALGDEPEHIVSANLDVWTGLVKALEVMESVCPDLEEIFL